jgi:hypothetical protein
MNPKVLFSSIKDEDNEGECISGSHSVGIPIETKPSVINTTIV